MSAAGILSDLALRQGRRIGMDRVAMFDRLKAAARLGLLMETIEDACVRAESVDDLCWRLSAAEDSIRNRRAVGQRARAA
jgi:hypothetical protein